MQRRGARLSVAFPKASAANDSPRSIGLAAGGSCCGLLLPFHHDGAFEFAAVFSRPLIRSLTHGGKVTLMTRLRIAPRNRLVQGRGIGPLLGALHVLAVGPIERLADFTADQPPPEEFPR